MAARENHHAERDKANDQPERTVGVGDHHVVAEHAPDHYRNTDGERERRLPAKAFHGRLRGLLLAFAAFGVVIDGFGTVTRFFNRRN